MGRLRQEWGDALRSLGRAPGHAATAIALLAIGVASTTAVLAVGDGLLRRPLPVRDDAQLIVPYGSRGSDERLSASAIDAEAWSRAPSLGGIAVARPQAVTLEHDGEPERLDAARIEAGYLPLLGVAPVLGRAFDASEVRAGARLALIGHGLWQRRFGGDPQVVGTALRIEGEPWEVIGVMPRGFDLPFGAEIWQPLDLAALEESRRTTQIFEPVARLAPGRGIEDARTELALIAERMAEERPDTHAGWSIGVLSLRRYLLDDPHGSVERAVGLTFWGAAFLLLIAIANVAQLQIVRVAGRQAELGTRIALGGSRASLARMLAFETLALSAVAAGLSLPLSRALAEGLVRLGTVAPTAFAGHLLAASYGPRVLAGVALVALVAGLASGVYASLRVTRTDVTSLLNGGVSSSPDRGRRLLLEGSVVAQVATTLVLLSATATLGESYALRRGQDVGFRVEGLAYYDLSLSPRDYAEHSRRAILAEGLVEALRQLDGVEAAAFTTNLPLASPTVNWIAGYDCEGNEASPGRDRLTADRLVGPGYLETLGLTLIAGRGFDDRDAEETERVAVINQTMAEVCWPGEDPLGRRVLRYTRSGWLPLRVVGVVADPQEQRVSFRASHAVWYLPYRQHAFLRDVALVVRGDAPPARVRALVHRLDPHLPVSGPRRVSEHLDEATGSERMATLVMGYFAVLGLVLVGAGLHGSMRRFVAQQQRAIGTRLALGAAPRRIVGAVLARGLLLAGLGAALGVAGALAAQRLIAAVVYATLLDAPARLGLVAAALLALALVSCVAPAYRASRIDPARLLRGA